MVHTPDDIANTILKVAPIQIPNDDTDSLGNKELHVNSYAHPFVQQSSFSNGGHSKSTPINIASHKNQNSAFGSSLATERFLNSSHTSYSSYTNPLTHHKALEPSSFTSDNSKSSFIGSLQSNHSFQKNEIPDNASSTANSNNTNTNTNIITNNNNIDNIINNSNYNNKLAITAGQYIDTNATTTPEHSFQNDPFHTNTTDGDGLENTYYINQNTNDQPHAPQETNCPKRYESISIATLPIDDILQMLTALLDKIVSSNDELNNGGPPAGCEDKQQDHDTINAITSFYGKHVPQITIEQYLLRIQKYCPTTNDIFLSLLVFFDRISKKFNIHQQKQQSNVSDSDEQAPHQTFVMDSYNIHRLLIAGVTVSTKFFSDFFYSNARYARVGGISLQEMNHLELQFLILCDFKLLIPIDELQRYAELLYRFWDSNQKPATWPT
ncbi:PHO85 cyclin family protein KNAG_0D01630 [Huiozyma naganishii CBS 8797]|uniref:Cyclin n=1 Tax=Huiozyma naganishii (strain ATCC MYA-139 / BCRC 22969 / CBS 8797 / KCTC 17520 / NBRC 10181 / NCYC 3082 / Yp74L-3) TaxID=1071383 RepID=J7R4Z3_HUIN7|nr:hypothetical protein KNAG_0D01630 [Kazachstania naganishii CBS 8797]CCK69915.1 hypothetical protein KNAG_0D01630 [Kazachstania naganishii CBS 8797]